MPDSWCEGDAWTEPLPFAVGRRRSLKFIKISSQLAAAAAAAASREKRCKGGCGDGGSAATASRPAAAEGVGVGEEKRDGGPKRGKTVTADDVWMEW